MEEYSIRLNVLPVSPFARIGEELGGGRPHGRRGQRSRIRRLGGSLCQPLGPGGIGPCRVRLAKSTSLWLKEYSFGIRFTCSQRWVEIFRIFAWRKIRIMFVMSFVLPQRIRYFSIFNFQIWRKSLKKKKKLLNVGFDDILYYYVFMYSKHSWIFRLSLLFW